MRLIYFLDYRFAQTPDGAVWTTTSYDAEFWSNYLVTFDHVTVVSRTRSVAQAESGWKRVDSESVSVCALPHYIGPWEYLRKRVAVQQAIANVLRHPGAVIVRSPAQLANCAYRELRRMGRPYAVENVGDGGAAMAPGVSIARGRAFFQTYFIWCQKRQNRNAIAASYVAELLKRTYPNGPVTESIVCSDVRLDETWLRPAPRNYEARALRLLSVATFTQPYKGLSVLLEALAKCRNLGMPFSLTLVGEGRLRTTLEEQARELGIGDAVFFRGAVAWGPELIEEYDRADLFVLPSLLEALPRAMIEAMARALPCIGTRVGAVSELLAARWIAEPGDAWNLATLIMCLSSQPDELALESARNLAHAKTFSASLLKPRWNNFYQRIASLTSSDETRLAARSKHGSMTSPAREG